VRITRIWNNLFHVRTESKDWTPINMITLGARQTNGLNNIAKFG